MSPIAIVSFRLVTLLIYKVLKRHLPDEFLRLGLVTLLIYKVLKLALPDSLRP